MKKRLLTILVVLVICLQFFVMGRLWWNNHLLKSDVYGMSVYAGTLQALVDYEKGKLRILELTIEGPSSYSGRDEGEFEIWNWAYYNKHFYYTNKCFIDAYNRKIKVLHLEAEKEKAIETESLDTQ